MTTATTANRETTMAVSTPGATAAAMAASPAIEIVQVTKQYGRVLAVDDLSFSVPEGALFGLIGANGAGKTTTFSLMSGFIRPTRGEVRVRGETLSTGHPPLGRVLALPQDATMPPSMTAAAVLIMLASLEGRSAQEARRRSLEALARVGLADMADRRVGVLSHGQRRRVGIASTLLGDDEVILLDEPTAGLDPRAASELRSLITTLNADRTIVVSSHNLAEIESVCTHAAIIAKGRLVTSSTMDAMKRTGTLVKVMLARPLSSPASVLQRLEAEKGVTRVELSADGLRLDLELEQAAGGRVVDPSAGRGGTEAGTEAEDRMNALLMLLIAEGASVRSVERGQGLEQRFLEALAQVDRGPDRA